MADTVRITIKNANAINNALAEFTSRMENKIINDSLEKAWTPLYSKMKQNARGLAGRGIMSNKIADSLVLTKFKKRVKGRYGYHVMFNDYGQFVYYTKGSASNVGTEKLVKGKRYFIPNAIEYGHASPGRGGGKNAPKDVPAKPFMRPALDSTLPNAAKIFEDEIERAIREVNSQR